MFWARKWKVDFNPSKTEVIFIGSCPEGFQVNFNNTLIEPSSTHKHVGITFSSNGKWSDHIDHICKSALKEINVVKKLKYTLSRSALNKIYNTFILPLLEYACEVWDGCSKGDEEKLEKVHLEAVRVVTGLPIFASRDSLYFETGWETLKERRLRRKLSVFYKIFNNTVPDFLTSIITPIVEIIHIILETKMTLHFQRIIDSKWCVIRIFLPQWLLGTISIPT